MFDELVLQGIEAYRKEEYKLAQINYMLAVKKLKSKVSRSPEEEQSLALAFSGMALSHSIILINKPPTNFLTFEESVLENLNKAEKVYNSLDENSRKIIRKKLKSNQENTYDNLRNSCWNMADDFIAIAKKEGPETYFLSQKNLYLNIINYLQKYIDYSEKMLNFGGGIAKHSEVQLAKEHQAEVYDWLSDLYFDLAISYSSTISKKHMLPLLNMALKYNKQAVSIWIVINPGKDISSLQLGFLNIMHHVFENNKIQGCLDSMSEYINTYLKNQQDKSKIAIEILGHQFYIASNKIPVDTKLATELAKQIMHYEESSEKDVLGSYISLAKTYLAQIKQDPQSEEAVPKTVVTIPPQEKAASIVQGKRKLDDACIENRFNKARLFKESTSNPVPDQAVSLRAS